MVETIKSILSKNVALVEQRKKNIFFEKDFEGKRLLNKEVSRLYDKSIVLTDQQLVDIVVDSSIIIEKMARLKNCDWDIAELKDQLESGIFNYKKQRENPHLDKSALLNATAIGKYFNVSSQRLNLILSELGWIEKNVAGWDITKLGKSIGGKQFEHDTSGSSYVLWPSSIYQNKRLLEVFGSTNHESSAEIKQLTDDANSRVINLSNISLRDKYPPTQRTLDGHYVRSKSEALIDNFLYINGIVHAYERKLPIEEDVYCDFYIPSGKDRPQAVYIEFWGLDNDQKYLDRKKKKIEIYKKYEFPLIELSEQEIQNLEEVLTRKLIQNKIKVH